MLQDAWRSAMISLARSPRARAAMQSHRSASLLHRRFVAGRTASHAARRARELAGVRIRSSLYYLGEYVDRPELVERNVAAKLDAVRELSASGLDVDVSVDPTQVGHAVDPALAVANVRRIADAIVAATAGERPQGAADRLMLDMEDPGVVAETIVLHDRLAADGLPVALTLQANLRRTRADLAAQIAAGSRVRLVKGAFVVARADAHSGRAAVTRAYADRMAEMLSGNARRAGFAPVIATHDHRLHRHAVALARRNGWRPGQYEFEMLLGVRPDVAAGLAAQGERVRLYVPFGDDWWPYAARRVGEHPRSAVMLARALLS
jgi:proline dehydrogenase